MNVNLRSATRHDTTGCEGAKKTERKLVHKLAFIDR